MWPVFGIGKASASAGPRKGGRDSTARTPEEPGRWQRVAGDGLLSQALSSQVPSALQGLTAVFGMGTGVAPAR